MLPVPRFHPCLIGRGENKALHGTRKLADAYSQGGSGGHGGDCPGGVGQFGGSGSLGAVGDFAVAWNCADGVCAISWRIQKPFVFHTLRSEKPRPNLAIRSCARRRWRISCSFSRRVEGGFSPVSIRSHPRRLCFGRFGWGGKETGWSHCFTRQRPEGRPAAVGSDLGKIPGGYQRGHSGHSDGRVQRPRVELLSFGKALLRCEAANVRMCSGAIRGRRDLGNLASARDLHVSYNGLPNLPEPSRRPRQFAYRTGMPPSRKNV